MNILSSVLRQLPSLSSVNPISEAIPKSQQKIQPNFIPIKESFLDVLERKRGELEKVEMKTISSGFIQNNQLIKFQITAYKYGLAVEVCSKIADGISQTIRKFHSNQ